MSESKELEQLRSKRAELEQESHSLEERQRNLDERTKVLEEKITIRNLESDNEARRQAIAQLESKMSELEQKLEGTATEPETNEPTIETKQEATEADSAEPETPTEPEETEVATTEPVEEEPEEETVEVRALEEPAIAEQENYAEDLKRQNERRKRRFF